MDLTSSQQCTTLRIRWILNPEFDKFKSQSAILLPKLRTWHGDKNTTSGPREWSAKPSFVGSNPTRASKTFQSEELGMDLYNRVVLELKDGVGEKERPNNAHNRS